MIDYHIIFQKLSGNYVIIKANPPYFTLVEASDRHLKNVKKTREEFVGKDLFEVFPDISGNLSQIKDAIIRTIQNRISSRPPIIRYDIPINGSGEFEERYWSLEYSPIFNSNEEVVYILQSSTDITELVKKGLYIPS